MTIRIRPKAILFGLAAIIAILVLLHLAAHGCGRIAACRPFSPIFIDRGYLFDLSTESNIPTWYAVIQLAAVALALCLVAAMKRAEGETDLPWWGLAFLFTYLSLDEGTDLHGLWIGMTPDATVLDERTGFDWIIAGSIIVLVIALLYIPWVLRQSRRTRNLFLLAGGTYVIGGMGFEGLGALVSGGSTYSGIAYRLTATAEETLEMVGVLVMFYAVLAEMGKKTISIAVD